MKSGNRVNLKNGCSANKFLIYGKHPFFSVLRNGKRKVYEIYVSEKNRAEFLEFAEANNIVLDNRKVEFVNSSKLDSIFPYPEKNHQGYILFAGQKHSLSLEDFVDFAAGQKNLPRLILLDSIQDPHNLGAIIRTAAAFGIENIIITSHNSVRDTSVVAKTSVGLSEVVNLIEVVNLSNAIKELKNLGYFVIGLDGEARNTIDSIGDPSSMALVLGSEGRGIRDLVRKNCDELVKIPMANAVESLNVSVASAIAIYELWG